MPKNRVVASVVGNLSPVKRSTAILVRRVLHLRGDMGEELNNRAVHCQKSATRGRRRGLRTILEDRSAIQLETGLVSVLVFLCVTHPCS